MKLLGLWALLSCGALLVGALTTPWWIASYFHATLAAYGAEHLAAAAAAEFLAKEAWSMAATCVLAAAGAVTGFFMWREGRKSLRAWRGVCALALLDIAVRWAWFDAEPTFAVGWVVYWCAMGLWGELCARRTAASGVA